jgi:transposase InsO family protein
VDVKLEIVHVVAYAKDSGIARVRTCSVIQINCRRVERWTLRLKESGSINNRKPGPKHVAHALLPSEKEALIAYVSREETADYSIQTLAIKGAEEKLFYMSASSVRKTLYEVGLAGDRRPSVRRKGTGRKPNRPDELTGPNQCWCWDISYIHTDIPRFFRYLFVMLDEWSRKVLAWRLGSRIAADEALALIDDAFLSERLLDVPEEKKPVIINDRGAQMKAKPVRQMFTDLGLSQEFARPRTPNDNPYIESLFGTVKTAPEYPGWFPADDIAAARDYFERYFHWYNTCHYHSRIGYVHPIDKHEGHADIIIKERKKKLTIQMKKRKIYWSTKQTLTGSGYS